MNPFHLQFMFISSLALSLVLTPFSAFFARKFHIVDRPAHRKTHQAPVAYLGGAAILLSLMISFGLTFLFLPDLADDFTSRGYEKAFVLLGVALGVGLLGLLDDLRDLPARDKFMGQLVFALAFAFFAFRFSVLHLPGLAPVNLGLLSIPVTVFWILSILNAFNMIDGVDGLAATVTMGSLALLAIGTSVTGNEMELVLVVGALGAVLGFLPSNWKPAKIYLGDAGSGGLGMFVACSLVAMGEKMGGAPSMENVKGDQPFFYQILIATLMVAYPALEITLSVARRLLRGKPIWRADTGHIHHRFLKLGWSPQVICLTALGLTLLPGLVAVATMTKYHGWAAFFLVLCGLILGFGLSILGFLDFLKPKFMDQLRPHYQIAHHFISMQKVKLSLASTREEVLTLVDQVCHEMGVKGYRLIVRADDHLKGGLDYTHAFDPTRLSKMPESSLGPLDSVRLPGGLGGAEWMFEVRGKEEELDVEYRVLLNEFMRAALEKASDLGKHQETLEYPSVVAFPQRHVSGHQLRKKHSHQARLN